MKNKLVAKFNPDGTLKSLTGEAPNLNALAQLCVNVIYKMASNGYLDEAEILVERSGRQLNWPPAQGWKKSRKNWKRKRK